LRGASTVFMATATVCAKFGSAMRSFYIGWHDVERRAPNVFRHASAGGEVIPVTLGGGHRLKDAMNDALRDWRDQLLRDTFY